MANGSTAQSDEFGLNQLGQIAVTARDVDRATAFYRDTLGLTFLFRAGDLSFFDCGGVRLMLSVPESGEFDHPSSIFYFRVADLDATYAALSKRGVTFTHAPSVVATMPDHTLWMAFFTDSEGNTLALRSEVPLA
jgi:predicted enzyme related to lactoylglutathione lyase